MNNEDVSELKRSLHKLLKYCEAESYKGWDPYDGLNSKFFQLLPLKHWDLARLCWIQGFKRSPINFRKLFGVPKEYNSKGIGLFLSGYCNLYKIALKGNSTFGTPEDIRGKIVFLSELLLKLKRTGYSGACWGYNFDWQARRLFLFPAHTPTVVATTFCASALFEAYEITKDEKYLSIALSSADFILKDLHRTETESGYILSYSPLPGNNTVYNASLLGAKLLSFCYKYTANITYKQEAIKIISSACAGQNSDGSWIYGLLPVQNWIDSFHTGYNLDAISTYQMLCEDKQFNQSLKSGFNFYIENFFLPDGTPKYYHDKVYPIDIHCPGQLWVTLNSLNYAENYESISFNVAKWTIDNMQDDEGYFYYQMKQGVSSKIPYMRWSNAFMFNALSCLLLDKYGK